MQQQRERAERRWLQSNAPAAALHTARLKVAGGRTRDEGQSHKSQPHKIQTNKSQSFSDAPFANTRLAGTLVSAEISELSGLAAVQDGSGRYWAMNDSGNAPELFIISPSGQLHATLKLPVGNRDWEDLASFTVNNERWVMISDTGDNLKRRAVHTLYFFKHLPDLDGQPQLVFHHQIDFSYQGGPRNVESVSVSTVENKIYLIAKENGKAGIYTLPLVLDQQESEKPSSALTAVQRGGLAELFVTSDDAWWERAFAQRWLLAPTALDISADDQLAVVANYRHLYLFRRQANESWVMALARKPEVILTHRMEQSESVAFSVDSERVIVSSEGRFAPVLQVSPAPRADWVPGS